MGLRKGIFVLLTLQPFLVFSQNTPDASGYPAGTVSPYQPSNFCNKDKGKLCTNTLLTSPLTTEGGINPTDYNQSRVKADYMDGLGRLGQSVEHFASSGTNDVVNVVKYDNLGRAAWHFLPYSKAEPTATDNGKFKLTAYTDQKDFYKDHIGVYI